MYGRSAQLLRLVLHRTKPDAIRPLYGQIGFVGAPTPWYLSAGRVNFGAMPSAAATSTEDDVNKARFVRFFAAIFMLSAGLQVIPVAAAAAVDHAVQLMAAPTEFLRRAGVSRLNILLNIEAARRKAAECGAIAHLLKLLDATDAHGGSGQEANSLLSAAAMNALSSIATLPEGIAGIAACDGERVLGDFVQQIERTAATEDSIHQALRLLADLKATPGTDGSKEQE
jgi:hypothetical protein